MCWTWAPLAVNGSFTYLGVDGLGSASVALVGSGSVQASVLYGPYGAVRYSSGTMPGSYGYTGQHADTTTGLDYYNARYYDASAGQFASADTARDGLNRYGYVHGNPTTMTDPSGHAPGGCIIDGGQYYCPPQPPAPTSKTPPPGCTGCKAVPGDSGGSTCHSDASCGNGYGTCDQKCQDDSQAVYDRQQLTDYYEGLRNQNHLNAAIGTLVLDIVVLAVDWIAQAWVNVVTDVLTLIVQGLQVIKDAQIVGGASVDSLKGLNGFLAVAQALVVVMNSALAFGWIAMLLSGPGGIIADTFKAGVAALSGTLGSMLQAFGAWDGMTDDAIDAKEASLDSATSQQIRQQCQAVGLSSC